MSLLNIKQLYSRTRRTYKILGSILIVGGIVGIGLPFINIFNRDATASRVLEDLGKNEITAHQALITASPSTIPTTFPVSKPITSTPTKPATVKIQNRLIFENAGINMPLFWSSTDKALLKGGWVYSSNSSPDSNGNTVIFGHRWLYKPPIKNTFYSLDKAQIGDKFTIIWNGKTYNYIVGQIKIVDPTEVSVLNQTNSPQVTLITCTPLFSTKMRLVVVGHLI